GVGAELAWPREPTESANGGHCPRDRCNARVSFDRATAPGGQMRRPHRRRFLHLAAGAVVLSAGARPARAQAYPTRPITLVVPFAAGGSFDVIARVITPRLSEILGQQVIVGNVGAAGCGGEKRWARPRAWSVCPAGRTRCRTVFGCCSARSGRPPTPRRSTRSSPTPRPPPSRRSGSPPNSRSCCLRERSFPPIRS